MTKTNTETALLTQLTVDVTSAYLGNNSVTPGDVPNLIKGIYSALSGASGVNEKSPEPQAPAVSIKKSLNPDYLICLEDGRRFKSLKRHLKTKFNLSPEDYRAKWGLPKTYPMVAPAYAAARSTLAKQMGLGQGGRSATKSDTPAKAKTRAAKSKASR